jgi:hypothetical protein
VLYTHREILKYRDEFLSADPAEGTPNTAEVLITMAEGRQHYEASFWVLGAAQRAAYTGLLLNVISVDGSFTQFAKSRLGVQK